MSVVIDKVVTDRFEMKYAKFGKGERTAVILPGLSVKSVVDSGEAVASAYKSMIEDYTVYLFDRRTVCPQGYTIKDMADDTAEAFDVLGLKDIYIFAVSQGGMIAQSLVLNHPEFARKLVLCSTVSGITEDNSKVIREWIKYAEEGDEESLDRSISNTVYSDDFNEKYGDFIVKLISGASEEELKRFIILAKSMDGFDVTDRLGEIRCPTLVIGSKADKVFDYKYVAEVAEKSGALMKTYEGYSHAVYDETPDCLKEVLKFYDV